MAMRKSINALTRFLLLFPLLIAACVRSTEEAAPIPCILRLRLDVRQGPGAGFILAGDVSPITEPNYGFSGVLLTEDGRRLPMRGQIQGLAINWTVELGENSTIYAVGTMQEPYSACTGTAGGSLSGPQSGDSGDWRGAWLRQPGDSSQNMPSAPLEKETNLSLVILSMGMMLLLFVGAILIFALRGKRIPILSPETSSALRQPPERWQDEAELPIAQFSSTYMIGDDRYDVSFAIEHNKEYLGECGAGVGADAGKGKPRPVTALEAWMFDKNDVHTETKILLSRGVTLQPDQKNRLARKGELLVLEPGKIYLLQTQRLRLRIEALAVEYVPNTSVLRQVRLKFGVWWN